MGFFKTKEEKLALQNAELERLKDQYKQHNYSLMSIGDYIFVFRGFEIMDDEIKFCYQDKDTPSEQYNLINFSFWKLKYGDSFKLFRKNWIYLKDSLDRLGVDVIIRE